MKRPRITVPSLIPYNKNVAEPQEKIQKHGLRQAQLDRAKEQAKELFSGPWPQWADPDDVDRALRGAIEPELAPPNRAVAFTLELRLPNQYTSKTAVLWHRFNYLVLPIPGVVLD